MIAHLKKNACWPFVAVQHVLKPCYLQDRFEHVVPILNKLGNTTVGLTLMLIGILGVIESRQHQQETTEQLQPVTAEGVVIQGSTAQI